MSLTSDKIDTAAAAQALRALALGGLTIWLDARQGLPTPSAAGLEDIAAALADEKDLTNQQRSATGRLSRAFLMSDPPTWSVAQTRWISAVFRTGVVRRVVAGIKDLSARLMGCGPVAFNPLAPALAQALAQDAFSAPAFRRAVSEIIRQHARDRVIMHPDGGKPARVGQPTLWAAAAEGATALSHTRLETRLKAKAAKAVKTSGWAGFWDGYLFQQARARGCDLPETDLTLHLTPQPDTPPQFRHAWRDEVPGYGPHLIENSL